MSFRIIYVQIYNIKRTMDIIHYMPPLKMWIFLRSEENSIEKSS